MNNKPKEEQKSSHDDKTHKAHAHSFYGRSSTKRLFERKIDTEDLTFISPSKVEAIENKPKPKKKTYFYTNWPLWIKVLVVLFIILVFILLIRFTGIASTVFALVLAIAPLIFALILSWILNPVVLFLHRKLGVSIYFWRFLIFILFILVGYSIVVVFFYFFFQQFFMLLNVSLGDSSAVKKLVDALKANSDANITNYSYVNDILTLVFSNGTTVVINGKIGALYLFIIKVAVSVGTFFPGSFYYNVASFVYNYTYGSHVYNEGALILGVMVRFIIIVLFTTFILFFSLARYGSFTGFMKKNLPIKDPVKKRKFISIFNFAVSAWIKGLLFDEIVLFTIVVSTLAMAGYIGNSSLFKTGFLIFAFFFCFAAIVPIFGVIIGALPIVLASLVSIALNDNYLPLIIALSGVVFAVGLEALVTAPFIYHKTARLHPVTILLGLSVFLAAFGFWAAPFTVPVLAIVKGVGNEFYGWKLNI